MGDPGGRGVESRSLLATLGFAALALAALSPLLVRVGDAGETAAAECEIRGLAEYAIEEAHEGSCTPTVYVRACRTAQLQHRERCHEFCGSLKDLGGRRFCVGASRPMAQLFDPDRHCKEVRHERFEVACRVTAACACNPGTSG